MTYSFVSPPQYVQAVGALEQLGPHVQRLGGDAVLLADEVVLDIISGPVARSFSTVPNEYDAATFGGECTEREITRLTEVVQQTKADVIVGAGGGKAIDVAKCVRARVGGTLVSLPTLASTDAPTSGLSVVYTDDGDLVGGVVHDRRPDLVLVDTAVVAHAPTRWFVSGVGDALATWFEATATVESGGKTLAGEIPTQAGLALAERCYEVLRTHAPAAVRDVNDGAVTDAVEATTEAIILLSGLGFENGGLAGAHALHDGISSTVETEATHGEKVCFGLLTQLVLERRPREEIREIVQFVRDLGLPTTLADVGVDTSQVESVADAACRGESTMTNQPSNPAPTDVREALVVADELGQSRP